MPRKKKVPAQLPPAAQYELTVKQTTAIDHLEDPQDKAILYGGAKGGGKSFLFCVWVYTWCLKLIDLLKIPDDISFPLAVGFMGRKRAVDFGDTTLETWKKIIPATGYEIKTQEKEIIIHKKVKIMYGGLDSEEDINKFNSAEFAFIAIDQAEETSRMDVSVLQATLRLTYNGIKPPYKQLYTANPAECWLKEDFITKNKGIYVPALYSDNPHLPSNYVTTLESAFSYDEAILRAYRDGDWDALQADYVLIPSKAIEALKGRMIIEPVKRMLIATDPSQGGDECVTYIMEATKIIQTKIMHEKDTMKITGELDFLGRSQSIYDHAIDSIGIGAGICDRLKELGHNVYRINSAEKSQNPHFFNLRDEMWFNAAELIREGRCEYPEDEELRRELVAVRYEIANSNGQLKVEPKVKTKKRLGRSPDRADAFVYGLWCKDHGSFGRGRRMQEKNLPRTAEMHRV